ncbi:MAG TPA: cupin domain-containing protein [Thermoleophilaceae bacterium]|jgi:quercetin dioxygenase-like cupin family protein|nr:cupin domain-containing protein [Thermoleophilaceae bacterium]
MDIWDIRSLDVQPHQPQILRSDDGAARAIAIHLPAGEELQEHEVHEHAYLVVMDGEVELGQDGENQTAAAGTVAHWVPQQRHEVRATSDAKLLLVLAPWPGLGHPSNREERAT